MDTPQRKNFLSLLNVKSLLPSLDDYRRVPRTWRKDLLAGVTVGIVALPLALAFGVSSGAGAESGLITAIIAGVVAAIFGGSNVQVSGPTGAMVVVLGPIVAKHGVATIALVSLMAGIIVLAAGFLRLGRTVSYIPWPVIEGFTLGIAVIIFLQQVPSAIGAIVEPGKNSLLAAIDSFSQISIAEAWMPILLVAIVVITMLVVPMIHQALPASLIAVVVATLVAIFLKFNVTSIGELPSSLPPPHLPHMTWDLVYALLGPAFAVAALAAIESLLSARVASSISETGPYDADRELVGQGLASVASGFFGGMPATGAIARTAVNIRAGGQTRLSVIVHSVVLLVVVYAASTIVSVIPLAALAGVLMVTSARMVSAATALTILRSTRSDAVIFVMTAVITISFDLIYAVVIGVAAAGFAALRQLAKTSGVEREALPLPVIEGDEKIAVYRIDGALFFGTADKILHDLQDTKGISVVILRMSKLQMLDATGAQVITELVRTLEAAGITVLIKGIQASHTRLAEKVGVISSLRHQNHLFSSLDDAIAHARSHA
ncbi:MAG TPA: SulP family inorganic anion transporter [Microbacteriaceae bacterium]|nr:SulP family inorganic anion transporter [Microbacteriaceae bacterium]